MKTSKDAAKEHYVELFWDCPECGQPHISAVFNPNGQRCPNCFYWRQDDDQLYEAADSQIITDAALIHKPPHWICKVCGSANPDEGLAVELLQCGNCDSYQTSLVGNITGNENRDQQAPKTDETGEVVEQRAKIPESRFENPVVPKSLQAKRSQSGRSSKPSHRPIRWLIRLGLIGTAAALTTVAGVVWLVSPTQVDVQVKDLTWTVTIPIEEYRLVDRADWDESVPTGATIIARQTKIRSYVERQQGYRTETYWESERYRTGSKKVCKTTSQGNGVGKKTCKDEPTYDTRRTQRTREVPNYIKVPVNDVWVTYRIKDWVATSPIVITGRDDQPRPTKAVTLPKSQYPLRQLAPTTQCQVFGIPKEQKSAQTNTKNWQLDCAEYDRLEPNTTITLEVNKLGQVRLAADQD